MQQTLVTLVIASHILSAQPGALSQRAKPYLESARAAGQPFVVVSAASGMPNLAAGSLAAINGQNLATQTTTGAPPFPTSLGGIALQVVDSAGAIRIAQLLFVSPGQVNFLIPSGSAAGMATLNIVNGTGNPIAGTFQIQPVAPALFTANEDGQGVVSATAYHTVLPTTIAYPVPVFECLDAPGSCRSVPIVLGIDVPVFITLNATGLRGRSSDGAVHLTIGGQEVLIRSITALDDSSAAPGVDQLVVPLPLSLRGVGEVDVVITVDGTTSNTGRINIM